MQPTIVLIHGAFAESASWDRVIDRLLDADHPVVAAPNPLRSVAADAVAVGDVVRSIDGPVVLAAHSYGGAVMSSIDRTAGDIVGLVYVNAFAPDTGESCFELAGKFPGSMLGETTLRPVPRSDGTTDLVITPDRFQELFCPDVPAAQAARMAVTQRPGTQEALVEPAGERPLWKELPSCFLIGEQDRIIPPALQHFMAERAAARRTIEVPGASHGITVSQPEATAQLILEAAISGVPPSRPGGLDDDGGGTVAARDRDHPHCCPTGPRRTAVAHRTPTAELGALAQPGGELFGLEANGRGRYVMFGGGLPLTDGDGAVIGAVGVSGAAVAEDVACAEAAQAALLT